jgi:hypothetical protein
MRFQLCDVQVLWSWHHRLPIWTFLSVIRGLAVAAVPWMLTLWGSRGQFLWKQSLRDEYSVLLSCHLCCSSSVIFRKNSFQCTTISFYQCWFVHADITLKTVTLDTPNNVAVFVTDAPAKRAPTICPLSKSDKSPISQFFHTDCHSAQLLMHWHEHNRM